MKTPIAMDSEDKAMKCRGANEGEGTACDECTVNKSEAEAKKTPIARTEVNKRRRRYRWTWDDGRLSPTARQVTRMRTREDAASDGDARARTRPTAKKRPLTRMS